MCPKRIYNLSAGLEEISGFMQMEVQEATTALGQDDQQWSHTMSVPVLLSLVGLMDEKRECKWGKRG